MEAVIWLALLPLVQDLKPDEAKSLHAMIQPQPREFVWTQIPWLSDLWEARRQASEKGRPIFLWEMDGHPLGCV
jgi:hypothetical protein